jgi:hypothetical protein
LRTENGIKYGDTIDHVDFPYLAKMTKLDAATLASIASAPPPPAPKVEGAVSTDTTLTWAPVQDAASYNVRWRRTDANQWQVSRAVPASACAETCKTVLPHIRVDDWVFGVASVSKDGFESPVASAVPGGAFHPYVAPPKKP